MFWSQVDCVDAFPKSRKKEVGDIKDIIKNRMKTLNILEIERKLLHNWSLAQTSR